MGSAAAVTASSSPLGHGVGIRSRRSRRVTTLPLHMQGILLAWSRLCRDSDEANRYAAICGTQVQPGSIEGGSIQRCMEPPLPPGGALGACVEERARSPLVVPG